MGINQVEQEGSKQKCMRYKPKNISELSAFVAAIRPGFKSMYDRFENREDFSWGIPALDKLLRTEELPVSFLFFQEQVMAVLNYAGFPIGECYGIIKAIAKKHPEKVRPLKARFIEGFKKRLMEEEGLNEEDAQKNSDAVWIIINDNCGYSFNSSHAYCMALDSLYQAWQKAHYPYEFYEVLLQHYTDKGDADKVVALKKEMKQAFGIEEGHFKFGQDNTVFKADKEQNSIIPSLTSIKFLSDNLSRLLYGLRNNNYIDFFDVLIDLDKSLCDARQLDILIKLDYFSQFGTPDDLLDQVNIFNYVNGKKELTISKLEENGIPVWIATKNCKKITAKKMSDFNAMSLMRDVVSNTERPTTSIADYMRYDIECLGYTQRTISSIGEVYYICENIGGYSNNLLYLHNLKTGEKFSVKYKKFRGKTISVGDIIKIIEISRRKKWRLKGKEWVQIDELEDVLTRYSFLT